MKRLRFTLTAAAFAALLLAWWATRPKTPTGPAPAPAADVRASAESPVPPEPPTIEAAPAPAEARSESGGVSAESDAEPLRFSLDRWGTVRLDEEPIEREALRRRLVDYADGSREEGGGLRVSTRQVEVYVDPAAEWGPVRETLSLCADPEVRIWKILLRVGGTSHRLALDRDALARKVVLDGPIELAIRIRRVDEGLEYRLLDRDQGRNDAGQAALVERLNVIAAAVGEELVPAIEAAPDVRAAEVAEVLALCEAAGLPPARIEGAPPKLRGAPRTLEKEGR